MATLAMLDEPVDKAPASAMDLEWVGVKAAQFPFPGSGRGPRTGGGDGLHGEVACIGTDFEDAYLKAMLSVGYRMPRKGALLSTGPIGDKIEFLGGAKLLSGMGVPIYASQRHRGVPRLKRGLGRTPHWPLEEAEPNIATMLKERKVDLVINVPKNNGETELKNDYLIRRMAVDFDVPPFTNVKAARQFAESLAYAKEKGLEIKAWEEYR
jgi:carbamoyl-phosphate synthase large subunit